MPSVARAVGLMLDPKRHEAMRALGPRGSVVARSHERTARGFGLGWQPLGISCLGLLAAALPFLPYANFGDVPIFSGYLLVGAMGAISLACGEPVAFNWLYVPVLLSLLALDLSVAATWEIADPVVAALSLILSFMAFGVTTSLARGRRSARWLAGSLLKPAFAVGAVGVTQWLLINVFKWQGLLEALFNPRVGSWLYGAHEAEHFQQELALTGAYASWQKGTIGVWGGQYAAVGLFSLPGMNGLFSSVYLLAHLSLRPGWSRRSIWIRTLLLINILLTQSRSTWISLAFALAVYWLGKGGWRQLRAVRRTRRAKLGVAALLVAMLVAGRLVGGIGVLALQLASPVLALIAPSVAGDAGTTEGRVSEIPVAWDLFVDHLAFGVGVRYVNSTMEFHNEFLRVGVSTGVIGLVGYLGITLLPLIYCLRLQQLARDVFSRNVAACYKALWVLWTVSAFGYHHLRNPKDAMLFWLFTGLMMVTYTAVCRSSPSPGRLGTQLARQQRIIASGNSHRLPA